MEKGLSGDRADVEVAEPVAEPSGPTAAGAAVIRPGLISRLDGTSATLDEHPKWPSNGPAGEMRGAGGETLIKSEDGKISYVDPDGKVIEFQKWIRPADDTQPNGLGPRMYDVWQSGESGDEFFGQPHPNDVAQQLRAGGRPNFEPRSLEQLRTERATH